MKVGDRVRQKKGIRPKYGWGGYAESGDVGVITSVNIETVTIDFPNSKSWLGVISEMEVVTDKPETFIFGGKEYYFPNGVPSLKDVYDKEPCEDQWEIFQRRFCSNRWENNISMANLCLAFISYPSWLTWMACKGLVAEYYPEPEKKATVMVKGQEVAIEDLVDTSKSKATIFGGICLGNRIYENLTNKGFYLSPIAMWDVITDKVGIQVLVAVKK